MFAAREFLLERLGVGLEIGAHDLRTEPGEKQDQAEIAEAVGNRIRQRRVGNQLRFLLVGNRQLADGAESGAERCRLGHAARQESHGEAFVEAERRGDADHRGKAADGHDQREHDLRQGLLLQAAEKLRADRIADREQEQVEERPAQQVGQFGLGQDADSDAGQKGPDHGPEADALEVKAADDSSRAECSGTGTRPGS